MTDERPPDPAEAESAAEDPGSRLEALLAEHREPRTAEEADPFAPVPGQLPADGSRSPNGDSGNGGTDAEEVAEADDSLPEAPLFALLRNIQAEVGIDRIDRIWVFPPRRLQAGETAVVVVAAFPEIDTERRRVFAAHYTAHEQAREPRLAIDEYGTAPTERVGRLVEEVVERIKDEPAAAPRVHSIEGDDDRWNTILHELADAFLEEMQKNPRLRR